jgi:membrane-anchored glycerophosphoryl diester phosphodiesterase (GDPDase)
MIEKLKNVASAVTLEPVLILFSLSQGLLMIASQSLYIDKVCKVNLAMGDEICDNIQQHEEEQVRVQQYVAVLQGYSGILQSMPAIVYALFAGPWSDVNGRKMLIVCSTFGNVLNNGVFMINIYFGHLKAEYLLFEVK